MCFAGNGYNKKLRFFLLAIVFVLTGVIIAVFVGYRKNVVKPEKIIPSIEKKAGMFLDNVYHESIKGGIKEWGLNADSAYYVDEKSEVVLKDISVTFFHKDGGEIYLKAEHGILNTDSKNIDVKGNVVVETDGYMMTGTELFYDNNNRIIYSKKPVKITESAFDLTAASMYVYLKTNRVNLKGNVNVVFSAKYAIF